MENKISDARRRANAKWDSENLDRMGFTVPKGYKEIIKAHAEIMGESTNKFIQRAIKETIERESRE